MNARKPFVAVVIFVSLLGFNSIIHAAVKLPAIFGDHMVLQQKSSVAVWGWADPGEKVTVKGSWQWFSGKSVKADKDGIWKVNLNTPKAGRTVSLKIKGNENKIILNDVLIGEVWICSGQSNMEWTMKKLGTERGKADIEKANAPMHAGNSGRFFSDRILFRQKSA
jgi:sialate O-acetylesterase